MPVFLVPLIWAAGTAVVGLVGNEVKDVVVVRIKRKLAEAGPAAIHDAFTKMGLEIDVSQGLSDETLTKAINVSLLAGTGVELESIFDKEKLKHGLAKLAVKKASEQFGFGDATTEAGFKRELIKWVQAEAERQLVNGGEILVQAAKDKLAEKVAKQKPPAQDWNAPTDFSPEGVANRERQARYRANHKRVWVAKGGEA